MLSIVPKRVTLFAGHYGSGKTNIALNFARWLKDGDGCSAVPERRGAAVCIADLDIVNPYFRTKDSAAELQREGIELVVSEFANSNVDFPALPKQLYPLFCPAPADTKSPSSSRQYVVADIGGDDRGALALGRYVDDIRAENDYAMLGVINASRPLTRTPEAAVEVLREIEMASRLPFTGLVNNTNLGPATTAAEVLTSIPYAERTAALMGIPVVMTCASEKIAAELEGQISQLLPLTIQRLYYQMEEI